DPGTLAQPSNQRQSMGNGCTLPDAVPGVGPSENALLIGALPGCGSPPAATLTGSRLLRSNPECAEEETCDNGESDSSSQWHSFLPSSKTIGAPRKSRHFCRLENVLQRELQDSRI